MKSLGEQLKLARKSKNRSLEDISRDTNISKQYLEALEEDNYDILPGSAYVRGFLSNYARWVGLDPKAVVKQYNKLAALSELLESGTSGNSQARHYVTGRLCSYAPLFGGTSPAKRNLTLYHVRF